MGMVFPADANNLFSPGQTMHASNPAPQHPTYGVYSASPIMLPPASLNLGMNTLASVRPTMQPIGSFVDEAVLITALSNAVLNGLSFKEALGHLHGVR